MRFIWLLHDGKWSMRCIVLDQPLMWTGKLICTNKAFEGLLNG